MRQYFQLIRPLNCFLSALAVLAVGFILKGLNITNYSFPILLGMVVVFLHTGGGNALNDYFDRTIDKLNRPNRPIPSGKIKSQNALIFGLGIMVISTSIAFFINFWCFIIAFIAFVIELVYDLSIKRIGILGNLSVSALTFLLFMFGGSVVEDMAFIILIFAVLAFLVMMSREILKDIEDIKGDTGVRKTLPMKIGQIKSSKISAAMVLIAILITPLPFLLNIISFYYLLMVIGVDLILFISIKDFLKSNLSDSFIQSNITFAQNGLKIGMGFALITFLWGGIF